MAEKPRHAELLAKGLNSILTPQAVMAESNSVGGRAIHLADPGCILPISKA